MKKRMIRKVSTGIVLAVLLGMSAAVSAAEWQKPVYVPSDGQSKGARVTYEYKVDSLFRVNTKLGYVNDIELKPGETVTHIVGGDTKRWMIDKAIVGNVQHVYIKPIEPDIETNIIINTNQRAYRLYVVTGTQYDPLISFTFPDSPSGAYAPSRRARETDMDVRLYGKDLNRNYEIRVKKKADKALIPLEIFDDGRQTFIRMSKENRYDLPVLYSIDPWNKKNLSMVNYRVQGEYFVADGVYPQARLFYQQNFWIDFYNLERKPTVKGTMPANSGHKDGRNRIKVSDDAGDPPEWQDTDAKISVKPELKPSADDAVHAKEKAALEKKLEEERRRSEKLEKELAVRQEKERERERIEEERRKEKEARELAEKERQAEERRAIQERLAKETAEKERLAEERRLEKEKMAREAAERERIAEERRKAKEAEARMAAEREQERKKRFAEEQRAAQEEEARKAAELKRAKAERVEWVKRAEAERREWEKLERQREREEKKRLAAEERQRKQEQERKEREARIEKRMWERLERQNAKNKAGDAVEGPDEEELRKKQLQEDAMRRQREYDRMYEQYLRKQKEARRKAGRGGDVE